MIGETKGVGFQIGVSRTIPYPVAQVWELLTSRAGIDLWLGEGAELVPHKGSRYETTDGTSGEVRSFHDEDRIRLTWRPRDWDHDTTVQVAVSAKDGRTMLRFHQEWLADADERARQREHWQGVMARVRDALAR